MDNCNRELKNITALDNKVEIHLNNMERNNIVIDLSIIIPHYNSPQSLDRLISSIPIKSNIQVIVVDDKSNKGLAELKRLTKKYSHIYYLKNKTNRKGAGVCRNIGLKVASGEWIIFADADDFFVEGFYDKVSSFFHTDNEVIYFTPISLEIDTGRTSDRHLQYQKLITDYLSKKDLETETNLRYKFYVPWSKLINKKFLENYNINFDEVIASNDVMFSTKIGHYMENFDVTSNVIYCVTRDRGTLTMNTNIEIYDARVDVHINYCKFLKEHLDSKSYKIIKPHGMGLLFKAFKYKLGLKKKTLVYRKLRRNKVNIFNLRFIDPIFILKKISNSNKKHLNKQKYFSNKEI